MSAAVDEEHVLQKAETLTGGGLSEVLHLQNSRDRYIPFNWSKRRKWVLTISSCISVTLMCLNSTSIAVPEAEIERRFNINGSRFPNIYWTVTSWNVGFAVIPLLISPLMEEIAYMTFSIFLFPQAFAQNFVTLLVCRFISGGCAGVACITVGGIIGDIWDGPVARSVPMNIFILFYTSGIALGPVLAGAILSHLDWRWVFYSQLIACFAAAPFFLLVIEETRHTVILDQRAKRQGIDTGAPSSSQHLRSWSTWKLFLIRPLKMLFTEPAVSCLTLWSAFSLGTVFLFTQSVGQVYVDAYRWSEPALGLVISAVVAGQFVGFILQFFQDRLYSRSAYHNTESPGRPCPEARLYLTIPGSLAVAAGFFVYAWTAFDKIPWIAPTIALGMVGCGSYTVVLAVTMYLTDAYAKYSASVLAAVVLGENSMAAFLPLSAKRMYSSLGSHWASTLLGFVALLLGCIPIVLLIYGRRIRDRSPFMVKAAY